MPKLQALWRLAGLCVRQHAVGSLVTTGEAAWSKSYVLGRSAHLCFSAAEHACSHRHVITTVARRSFRSNVGAGSYGLACQNFPRLKSLVQKWVSMEQRFAAVINGVSFTAAGQGLLASTLPLALVMQLFPNRFQSVAYDIVPSQQFHRQLAPRPKSWFQSIKLPMILEQLLEEVCIWLRGLYLGLLFTPVVCTAPLVFYLGMQRQQWMDLLRWTLERAGPAFIKWGQWASTRPDMFPVDLCQSLELLQSSAPSHNGKYSRQAIEQAFGRPIHHLFEAFDEVPVASGSIAQIHRARLSAIGASYTKAKRGTTVAVKVRHPGVTTSMQRDFVLMERAAKACGHLPALSNLRLDESIRQFGGPLKEQLDLSVEAMHLNRFRHNFRLWSNVSFPTPMFPLVAPDVLVESFEDGDLISLYVNQPACKHRCSLAETGLHIYLQMLLKDNFIHADMHPGNILVREFDPRTLAGMSRWVSSMFAFQPKLILLDTGMIAELSKSDQQHLISFFTALTKQDGASVASSILNMSEQHTCKDPQLFMEDMQVMFEELDPEFIRKQTSKVIEQVIDRLRQHQVTLKSTVSTVVVTTLVLEGWSSKLNPDLHILDTIKDILAVDWTDRISRTVDKIMKSGTLAV